MKADCDWKSIKSAPKVSVVMGKENYSAARERLVKWSEINSKFEDVDRRGGIMLPFYPDLWRPATERELTNARID